MTQATTMIQEYVASEAVIATLRSKYEGAKFAVDTVDGRKAALEARAEIRKWRTGLEKLRVAIKAPALQRCQQIDSEAKRITNALLALESPIEAQITAEERKAAAEEAARVAEQAAKARAFDELQEKMRREAEQRAMQAQRDEISKQRAEMEAAAAKQRAEMEAAQAERRKADAVAAAARAEADLAAASERAAQQKKLDEERAALARESEERIAKAKEAKAAADAQLIANATLVDAATAALSLLLRSDLAECVETRALEAALGRVKRAPMAEEKAK